MTTETLEAERGGRVQTVGTVIRRGDDQVRELALKRLGRDRLRAQGRSWHPGFCWGLPGPVHRAGVVWWGALGIRPAALA